MADNKKYVGLHNHSFWSIADSLSKPEEMAKQAKELGMNAMSISDHGTLAGWLQFKDACKKYSIKPIFGCEFYFIDDQQTVVKFNATLDDLKEKLKVLKKEEQTDKKLIKAKEEEINEMSSYRNEMRKYNHLILLAKNWNGCLALIRIHNAAVIDGTYYKPRCDWNVLERYITKGDVIATSACLGGRISKLIASSDGPGAVENINRFNSIFGKGNFYLELQLNEINLQKEVNIALIELSKITDTPLVITTDSHFTEEGGQETRSLFRQLGDEDAAVKDDQLKDLYIKNEDMLFNSWKEYMPEIPLEYLAKAIQNTRVIADSVENFSFDTALKFPTFDTGIDDASQEDFLTKNAIQGLIAKGLHNKPEYVTRLKHELKTITKLGFASYFNVIGDIVSTARETQAVGCGRGCLTGDAPIYLNNHKIVPLKNVKIGDILFDHNGTEQKVLNTLNYDCNEKLISITTAYGETITMTNDHKIFTAPTIIKSTHPKKKKYIDKDILEFSWERADKVKIGDWLWVPKINQPEKLNTTIDLLQYNALYFNENYVSEYISNTKPRILSKHNIVKTIDISRNSLNYVLSQKKPIKSNPRHENAKAKVIAFLKENNETLNGYSTILGRERIFKRYIPIDEQFCYWLGRFTADGWIRKNNNTIGYAFHSNDLNGQNKLKEFLTQNEVEYHSNKHNTKQLVQIVINNKAWGILFKSLFFNYQQTAKTKHIPTLILECGNELLIKAFLLGYREGDGHDAKNKYVFTTVSKQLAMEIKFLFRLISVPCRMKSVYRDYKHLNLKNKLSITLQTPCYDKKHVARLYKPLINGYATRIRSIIESNPEKIYDLSISNSHSYLTDFAVHNSGVGSLVGYCLNITTIDPLKFDLYFQRFLDEQKGIMMPTFGLEIAKLSINKEAILKACDCHHD